MNQTPQRRATDLIDSLTPVTRKQLPAWPAFAALAAMLAGIVAKYYI